MDEELSALEKMAWNNLPYFMLSLWFNNVQLSVLGERGTGKTNLLHYLQHNALPLEQIQTSIQKVHGGFPRKHSNTAYGFLDSADLPGDKSFYHAWRQSCEKADWLVYLFMANRVAENETSTCNRIESDIRMMSEVLDKRSSRPKKILLIGTHCDLDPRYDATRDAEYRDALAGTKVFARALCFIDGKPRPNILTGNLQNEKGAASLLKEILE